MDDRDAALCALILSEVRIPLTITFDKKTLSAYVSPSRSRKAMTKAPPERVCSLAV